MSPTRLWCDIMEEENHQQAPAEWMVEVNRMLRAAAPGQHVNVLAAIMSTGITPAAPVSKTQDELDWSVWQDMVNEPEKYGDDIFEWLELDEKLNAGPKRWRVAAFWLGKEQELINAEEELVAPWRTLYSKLARQAAKAGERAWINREVEKFRAFCCSEAARRAKAATMIAAAVRGHQVRTASPLLNCCMCLAHRISPLKTDAGMMCRECAEQGPYTDITGPIVDEWNWFRAEGVDLAAQPKAVERCRWCFASLEDDQHGFCDADCLLDYKRETYAMSRR
jgi:hypothetical protein